MSEIYNQEYYRNDFGPISYEDPTHWIQFFGMIADHIVADIQPKTVLDAGCAMGYLVAALRDRGVDAYGVDISKYAISKVREDIRPFCKVGSLTEPLPEGLPKEYDLIVTIEVLEHLYAEDGEKAIGNLCKMTGQVLFSSTPDDFKERTHINVQQREYWARIFATQGFYDDVNYRPRYLTYHAALYKKKDDLLRVVEDYERDIRISESKYTTALKEAKKLVLTASLYWSETGEFEEEKRISVQYDSQESVTCLHFTLPENVHSLRFDPLEGSSCMLRNLEILSDQGVLIAQPLNGAYQDGFYLFTTTDPQVRIDLTEPVKWVRVQGNICSFSGADETALLYAYIFSFAERNRLQVEMEERYHVLQAAKEAEAAKFQECLKERTETLNAALEEKMRLQSEAEERYRALQSAKEEESAYLQERLKEQEERWSEMEQKLQYKIEEAGRELVHYQEHYHAAIGQREELKRQLSCVEEAYNEISSATCWKLTKPLRVILDHIKFFIRPGKFFALCRKGLHSLREYGWRYTWEKVKIKLKIKPVRRAVKSLQYSEEILDYQRKQQFLKKIKFSILVPLFNTPEVFLKEMIQSVQKQTYSNWQLCLADGSDDTHQYVEWICMHMAEKDHRIQYRKLKENLGISENTNACIEMATGDYFGLLDHDDLLDPSALFEIMSVICEKNADFIYTDENTFRNTPEDAYCPHYKPDFSPDTLRSYNYICHFTVFSKSLLNSVGLFKSEYDGSQDYDMILRLTEKAEKIVHIPKILYFWRAHSESVAESVSAKPQTILAAKNALSAHLDRNGLVGEVTDSSILSTYRIHYKIEGNPLVSILIPSMDHIDDLKQCLDSILNISTYQNYEIIVIENGSKNKETFDYYLTLRAEVRVKIIEWKGNFNYSAINNFGFEFTKGDYILLLNNDIKVITSDWIQEMLMFAQRKDVGAVGTMLYYPDDTIQHAGVIVGLGGVAGHSHKYFRRGECGYSYRLTLAQNLSAVTAACMMIPRRVYKEVSGLDEEFQIAFNDVDLCMRIREKGYLIVFTPYAELYHYESKSRGKEDTTEKIKRFQGEIMSFKMRWEKELGMGDPYYNPNLTLDREDFSLNF